MIKSIITSLITLLLIGQSSFAADSDQLTELLRLRLGIESVAEPVATPIEGVFQTRFGDKFAYLIDGGKYVFIGDLIDLKSAKNLTEASRRTLISDELNTVSQDLLTVFPADNDEKAILNVFTDTSCGYCQKLHKEVKYLQEAGITVRYFPYPRGGAQGPGYTNLKKVWCSDDRQKAMDIAKGVDSGSLGSDDCEAADFIDEGHRLGNLIGVTGTPALYTSSGEKFNGYVPYKQLIPRLLNNL
jgi:thiol:disulfide interchange protein DsbC